MGKILICFAKAMSDQSLQNKLSKWQGRGCWSTRQKLDILQRCRWANVRVENSSKICIFFQALQSSWIKTHLVNNDLLSERYIHMYSPLKTPTMHHLNCWCPGSGQQYSSPGFFRTFLVTKLSHPILAGVRWLTKSEGLITCFESNLTIRIDLILHCWGELKNIFRMSSCNALRSRYESKIVFNKWFATHFWRFESQILRLLCLQLNDA